MQEDTVTFTPPDLAELMQRAINLAKQSERARIITLLLEQRVIYLMADGSYGHNNLGAIQLKGIGGL